MVFLDRLWGSSGRGKREKERVKSVPSIRVEENMPIVHSCYARHQGSTRNDIILLGRPDRDREREWLAA